MKLQIKRIIFYIYDDVRILWNRFYNGHFKEYTKEELKDIKILLEDMKLLIKECEEELNNYSEE